jgi:hypothetical protein
LAALACMHACRRRRQSIAMHDMGERAA